MDEKSYRQNDELLLKSWFQQFDCGELFINITVEDNECNIWREGERLGEIIESYSRMKPYDGSSWSEYIIDRVGVWTYLHCNESRTMRQVVGTASDELPGDRTVVTVDAILQIADGRQMVVDEDFDSVFDC